MTLFIGSICGSTLGGQWSDTILIQLKRKHGGKMHPEVGVPNWSSPLHPKPETVDASPEYIPGHGIASPLRGRLRLDLPNAPAGRCNLRHVVRCWFLFSVGFFFF